MRMQPVARHPKRANGSAAPHLEVAERMGSVPRNGTGRLLRRDPGVPRVLRSAVSSLKARASRADRRTCRVLKELEQAREVQQMLFPKTLPSLPDWDFAAECRPAKAVAGDYYDLFEIRPGLLAVAVGDVSGKGLGPSLLMATLHGMIRASAAEMASNLTGLMRRINRDLEMATPDGMFVTLFLGILDTGTGELRFVNGGHPAPIVLDRQDSEPTRLLEGGLILGIVSETRYIEGHVSLKPGSMVALFSDGITEATDDAGAMLNDQRLLDYMRTEPTRSARGTLDGVFDFVDRFVGGVDPADDKTLVVIRRREG